MVVKDVVSTMTVAGIPAAMAVAWSAQVHVTVMGLMSDYDSCKTCAELTGAAVLDDLPLPYSDPRHA